MWEFFHIFKRPFHLQQGALPFTAFYLLFYWDAKGPSTFPLGLLGLLSLFLCLFVPLKGRDGRLYTDGFVHRGSWRYGFLSQSSPTVNSTGVVGVFSPFLVPDATATLLAAIWQTN